ncbi:MAG: MFS transporter [Betaproteobacteria bacterium]|nr:MFS transporter [Betaproteobacteria bacterium]
MPQVNFPARNLRWVVFALGSGAFFLSFFHRVAPAAIAQELTRAFEMSATALGALAATYFYIYTVMQLPTGVLADTLGPRRVLTAGGMIAGVGSIIFGNADSVLVAAVGRTLAGLGVAVAFISLLKLSANWFDERRFATASGVAQVIGISGALFATLPLAWLVTVVSWRSVFIAVGAVSMAVALMTWFMVRDQPEGPPGAVQAPVPTERWYRALGEVLRNRATWPCFWVNFGISGSYMSFIGLWAVPFLVHVYDMSPVAASRHTSVMLLAFAASVAGVGILSDRVERRRPIIIVSALLYCGFWLAWITGTVPARMTLPMFGAMGFIATGFTLSWACAKEVNRPRYAGMAISLANTGGFLAAGILQPLVGWMLDRTAGHFYLAGDFRFGLGVLGIFAACGLVGALFIRETRCRNIWVDQKQ